VEASLPAGAILRQAGLLVGPGLAAKSLNFYGPEPLPTLHAEGCDSSGKGFLRLSAKNVLNSQQWAAHPCRGRANGATVLVGSVISEGCSALSQLPSPYGDLAGI